MPKKTKKATTKPAPKTALEQQVEALMGPPPDEARPEPSTTSKPAPPKLKTQPVASEPSTAPLPPTELVPKPTSKPPKVQPATPPANEPAEAVDPATDEAVDDIIAKEGDDLLAAQDEAMAQAFATPPAKPKFSQRLKQFLGSWWRNKWARYLTIMTILIGLAAVAVVPTSRYWALNLAGVRSSATVTVLDDTTQLPLQNVTVQLANQTGKTDRSGKLQLQHLKLGATNLVVQRRGFADLRRPQVVGWGSNPLGDVKLTPSGSQYGFVLTDFLSGRPLTQASASSGEAVAVADKNGRIVLTIDSAAADQPIPVSLKADKYRTENFQLNPDIKTEQAVKMVPARKHIFVSKRSGKYDVFAVYADGKAETKLLPGTGNEQNNMVVVPHQTSDQVAIVSTRDNSRNSDGYLLSTLLIIDSQTGQSQNLGQSEKFKLINWVGNRLVYVQIAAGASASNPKRHRLISYDYQADTKTELASSNYFNDVMTMADQIYYAPSAAYQASGTNTYRVNADGTNRQIVLNKEVWTIFRTGHNKISLSSGNDWYEYTAGNLQAAKVSGPPADLNSRLYHDSPNKLYSLWVDNRDGKGVLLRYSISGDKKDHTLHSQSGLTYPTWWLTDNYVVYRVNTETETADYVLNMDGGQNRKLSDVTNAAGITNYQY